MDQVERVAGLVTDVAGADLIGTCLHGSAVLGGLRPASDVGILAVTRRSLGAGQRRALVAGLAVEITMARAGDHPLTGPRPARVGAHVDEVLGRISSITG